MHDKIKLAAHSVESDAVDTILAKAKECLDKVDDLDASHKLLADTFVGQHREQVRARVAELLQRADFVNVVESSMIEHLAANHQPEDVARAVRAWRTSQDAASFHLNSVLTDVNKVMGDSMTQAIAAVANDLNTALQELVVQAAIDAGAATR